MTSQRSSEGLMQEQYIHNCSVRSSSFDVLRSPFVIRRAWFVVRRCKTTNRNDARRTQNHERLRQNVNRAAICMMRGSLDRLEIVPNVAASLILRFGRPKLTVSETLQMSQRSVAARR